MEENWWSPWTAEDKAAIWHCWECGRKTLCWVVEDYMLEQGTRVPDLEHLKCSACGERGFDLAAMRKIGAYREKAKTSKQDLRKPKSRKKHA